MPESAALLIFSEHTNYRFSELYGKRVEEEKGWHIHQKETDFFLGIVYDDRTYVIF